MWIFNILAALLWRQTLFSFQFCQQTANSSQVWLETSFISKAEVIQCPGLFCPGFCLSTGYQFNVTMRITIHQGPNYAHQMLDFLSEVLLFSQQLKLQGFLAFFFFFFLSPLLDIFNSRLSLSFLNVRLRYSSLILEKYVTIMNIMTIFVYRAGRQGIKVRLLLMNLKEISVFRVEGNYAY